MRYIQITLKSKWLIGSMIILSMIFFFLIVYWHQDRDRSISSFSSSKKPLPLSPMVDMKGFAFDGYQGERRVLSIKADSLVIKKKKIGFFRFGLLNAAKLSKAVIDIYATEKIMPHQGLITAGNKEVVKQIDFEEAFSPAILKSMTPKQVSTLELEPATIRIHNNNDIILTIESGYSKISLRNGFIIFKKNVQVKAGAKILTTNNLNFVPARCLFQANDSFRLKTPQQELQGDYLEIDFYLDHIFTTESLNKNKISS